MPSTMGKPIWADASGKCCCLKIWGWWGFLSQGGLAARMIKFKEGGVKGLASQSRWRWAAGCALMVGLVAHNRHANRLQVHPNLMGSPCLKPTL